METMGLLSLLPIFTGGLFLWVHWIEPNWFQLRVKVIRVGKPLKRPITVLHLSDTHFTKERFFLKKFFNRLAELEPDFIFVTGDLIDDSQGIKTCVHYLKGLKVKRGIYAVLGNHDYRIYPPFASVWRLFTGSIRTEPRSETEDLKRALLEAKIHLLENESVSVPLENGEEASLIGIDDPVTGHANYERSFQGVKNGSLRLALIHSPVSFPILGQWGVDAAFAGHTHGGQVRLPLIGPLPPAYRLEPIIDSTNQYGFVGLVTRGVAAQPVTRLRLFCRPEAVLVRIEGS